jgi:hypothetical protein
VTPGAPDVAAAIEQHRAKSKLGLSETINQLIRRGLQRPERPRAFEQRTAAVGVRIDVANVAEALELLEGPTAR